MPRLPDLISGFKTLREVDLNAIRSQAEAPFHIAVIGAAGVGKTTLINQLLAGPGVSDSFQLSPLSEQRLDQDPLIQPHSTVILMLDASQPDHAPKQPTLERLRLSHTPFIICYNKADLLPNSQSLSTEAFRGPGYETVAISALDRQTILQQLVPALLRIYKGREVQLARNLPFLRDTVSQKLIADTCFVNATYSLATGLAEINIFVDLPLNLADLVMLTKNQALMAYKISLACGLSADWRQTIPKLAAVVGGGFLWRTLARQLVGLIPAFGIIPKVAVSFAATYAVGQAIFQWCTHNEEVNPGLLRSAYNKALKEGREVARSLLAKRLAQ
jgi:uncharacterized protein (DUF697 family)/signal recognition particle receptor subunit beta